MNTSTLLQKKSHTDAQVLLQTDEPAMRNARLRLDYKKSFEDDLIFFPEFKECFQNNYNDSGHEFAGYTSSDNSGLHGAPQYQVGPLRKNPYSQQSQHKENLSLLAFNKLEKQQLQQLQEQHQGQQLLEQQQQQQQQQQQHYMQKQLPPHVYSFQKGGQTFYSQAQQLPQSYVEQHQNAHNYGHQKTRAQL